MYVEIPGNYGMRVFLWRIVTTNPDRSVLIPIITWHFSFQSVNVDILNLNFEYGTRNESRFACYSHCYVTWCPLTKGRCARDALPQAFDIGVFKYVNNSITTKYIYNESANLNDNCDDAFDNNDWCYHPKSVQVIGMDSMVRRARLRYKRDYLPPGIWSLIQPAAMAKFISFPTKITRVML